MTEKKAGGYGELLLLATVLFCSTLVHTGLARHFYPTAAFLTSFVAYLSPGILLALILSRTSSAVEKLAVGTAVNFGVVGVLALPAYAWEWRLGSFSFVHGGLTLMLFAAACYRLRGFRLSSLTLDRWSLPLVLALIVLGEYLLFTFRTPGLRLDNYTYLTYVREFVEYGRLSWKEPLFQTGELVNVRMLFSFWLTGEALLAWWSGMDLFLMYRNLLSLPFLLLIPVVSYSLGKEVLRSRWKGLAAAAVQVAFMVSARGQEALGGMVYRIREDKVLAALVIFPVVVQLTLSFLREGGRRGLFLFVLAAAGLGMTHPIIAVFFAIAVMMLVATNMLCTSPLRALKGALPLLAMVSAAVVFPLIQKVSLPDVERMVTFSLNDSTSVLANFRLDRLLVLSREVNLYILNTEYLFNGFVVVALASGFLLIRRLRHDLGARYLFSSLYGFFVLVYVPGIASLTGFLVTPWQLWRIMWVMPFTLVFVYVMLVSLPERLPRHAASWRGIRIDSAALPAAVMLGAAVCVCAASIAVYRPFPYRLVPREPVKEADLDLYRYIRMNAPEGSTFLTERRFDYFLPAFAAKVIPLCYRGLPALTEGGLNSCRGREDFFFPGATMERRLQALETYRPDYVFAFSERPAGRWMEERPDLFQFLYETPRRRLFKVRQGAVGGDGGAGAEGG